MITLTTFETMISELRESIQEKVNNANVGETIKSTCGNDSDDCKPHRGLWKITLGSYRIDIDYSFVVKEGINYFLIHFTGNNPWDFEFQTLDFNIFLYPFKFVKWFLYNIAEEYIPSSLAGEGKTFDITYDFYYKMEVTKH